jgi:threonine dehydrogenase-like Zn-dependent dehydrogenase
VDEIPTAHYDDPAYSSKILLEIEWCGICGSDLHLYHGSTTPTQSFHGRTAHTDSRLTAPASDGKMPYTLGHEFCGVVKRVPPESNFRIGDRVIANPTRTCKSCSACASGAESQCPGLGFIGLPGADGGGLSEMVAIEEHKLHRVPKNVPMTTAVLAEPLTVAMHALRRAQVGDSKWSKQTVLVLGGGPIGYSVISNLIAFGVKAQNILVSEPTKQRLKSLRAFGISALCPRTEQVVDICKSQSASNGVDVVFDCAGAP